MLTHQVLLIAKIKKIVCGLKITKFVNHRHWHAFTRCFLIKIFHVPRRPKVKICEYGREALGVEVKPRFKARFLNPDHHGLYIVPLSGNIQKMFT